MEEARLKSTEELAKMLGISSYKKKEVDMEFILENASKTIQPKIKAVIELYKRSLNVEPEFIKSAEDSVAALRPLLMDLEHEELWAVMLNSRLQVVSKVKITQGGIDSCLFDVKSVCRNALLSKATCVVLAHNHPGGGANPSESDIKQTIKIKKALEAIEVRLVDHIIVAKGGDAYSFDSEIVIKN